MAMNLNSKEYKQLAVKPLLIKNIFPSYRQGWNPATKTMETFIQKDGAWKQQIWKEGKRELIDGQPTFKKEEGKVQHRKVYDVVLNTETPITVTNYKGTETTNEFVIRGLGASHIQKIAECTVAFGKVPMNGDRPAFDWEESFLDALKGISYIYTVRGEGLSTSYTYQRADFNNGQLPIDEKTPAENTASSSPDLPF